MDVIYAQAPLYIIPIVFAIVLLEVWLGHKRANQSYYWKDSAASLTLLTVNMIFSLALAGGSLLFYYWVYQFKLFDFSSGWLTWLLLVLAIDFCFYWFHRASHRVRVLWTVHINHHSSQYMNLITGMRQAFFGPVVRLFFFWPIMLIGFDPLMFATAGVIGTVGGFWVHTEQIKKMPAWFEYIFNTPSHHRVHHGSNPEYIDKNYGNLLIIWDRLFGTFAPEQVKPVYGLTQNINSYNPIKIVLQDLSVLIKELYAARSISQVGAILFAPPGLKRAPAEEG
jgi:sterol desaturase/sphingolipid hydroxylase (fatty acid hydroxylase superfamily)